MNVIGYIRVSTAGQAKDGYSLSYQKEEIETYCQQRGWNLLYVFSDEGISGAKVDEETLEVDRQGFQEMLAMVSTHCIDYVVVLNTNRLWRSDIVKVLVHREFKKFKVDVKSIEQATYSIYKKDPSDFLINGLMELLDAYQRLEIAMKLGKGRNKKAREGGCLQAIIDHIYQYGEVFHEAGVKDILSMIQQIETNLRTDLLEVRLEKAFLSYEMKKCRLVNHI